MENNDGRTAYSDNNSAQKRIKKISYSSFGLWLGGIGFTAVISGISFFLSRFPGLEHAGPLVCAIVIAVIYRRMFGYPEALRTGIQFSAKQLLRVSIILMGLKLNIEVMLQQGTGLILRDIGVICFAIVVTVWVGKIVKADPSLTLLVGIGTGVCGAAAIAAVSPILQAKEEDTAIGAGMIALVGTLFAITYTLLRPFLPLSAFDYGIWSGISLHEIAHVALAGAPAGEDALTIALLAKLGRVLLLVPLCFLLMHWKNRKTSGDAKKNTIPFPWFLVGFVLMSVFGSYVLGKSIPISEEGLNNISNLTTFILTSAMVGLGLNVNLHDLRTKAAKLLIAMLITSLFLSIITFFIS